MKAIYVLMLLAGVVLAPGYFFYCSFFSGKSLAKQSVFSQDVSRIGFGGLAITSKSDSKWNSPATFELSPEMNPISISAKIQYLKPKHIVGIRATNSYSGQLKLGVQDIWQSRFSLNVDDDDENDDGISVGGILKPVSVSHIKTFSVEEGGAYDLHVESASDPDIAVADIEIRVRRNVLIPNLKVVLGGVVSLVLSIVGLVVSAINGKADSTQLDERLVQA